MRREWEDELRGFGKLGWWKGDGFRSERCRRRIGCCSWWRRWEGMWGLWEEERFWRVYMRVRKKKLRGVRGVRARRPAGRCERDRARNEP